MRIAGFAVPLSLVALVACGSKKEPPPRAPAAPAQAPDQAAGKPEPERQEPATAPEQGQDLTWTAVSADNKVSLHQVGDRRGVCTARCVHRQGDQEKELWHAGVCFGTKLDLRFVANDCAKVAIIHQLPKALGIVKQTVVGEVFRKDKRDYSINAGACVRDWSKVRSAGTTFYWLAGSLGLPGDPPRYTSDGKGVELTTVDGMKHTIPLTVTK